MKLTGSTVKLDSSAIEFDTRELPRVVRELDVSR